MLSNSSKLRSLKKELEDADAEFKKDVQVRAPEIIADEYKKELQRAIDEKRSPGGKRHAPLRPKSRYPYKSRRNPDNHVLIDHRPGMREGAFGKASHGEIEIGFKYRDKRGREPQIYHQEGTPKMVQRQVVGLSNSASRKIKERFKRELRPANKIHAELLNSLIVDLDFGEDE